MRAKKITPQANENLNKHESLQARENTSHQIVISSLFTF